MIQTTISLLNNPSENFQFSIKNIKKHIAARKGSLVDFSTLSKNAPKNPPKKIIPSDSTKPLNPSIVTTNNFPTQPEYWFEAPHFVQMELELEESYKKLQNDSKNLPKKSLIIPHSALINTRLKAIVATYPDIFTNVVSNGTKHSIGVKPSVPMGVDNKFALDKDIRNLGLNVDIHPSNSHIIHITTQVDINHAEAQFVGSVLSKAAYLKIKGLKEHRESKQGEKKGGKGGEKGENAE
jgi:hypothetical protein